MPIEFAGTHFDVIDSTQTHLKRNLDQIETPVVITAKRQTQGVGSKNRSWASPPDVNVYATFGIPLSGISYEDLKANKFLALEEITGLAVAKTLENLGLTGVKIKWQNDVLVDGKKICGILVEPVEKDRKVFLLIGTGLNVNMSKDICDSLDQPVTSMAVATGCEFAVPKVFAELEKNLGKYLHTYLTNGFSFKEFAPEINARLAFVGKTIKVKEAATDKTIEGVCKGIDDQGRLILQAPGEKPQIIRYGSIVKDQQPAEIKKPESSSLKISQDELLYFTGAFGLGLGGAAWLRNMNKTKSQAPFATEQKPMNNQKSQFPLSVGRKSLGEKSRPFNLTRRGFGTHAAQVAAGSSVTTIIATVLKRYGI